MSKTATSPLELWNLSRRLAAAAYRVSTGEESFATAAESFSEWPFASEEELTALVEGVNAESRAEAIETIQRILHERLKPTMMGSIAGGAYDNRDVIREWNAARSAATDLLSWVDNPEKVEYDEIQDEHEVLAPLTAPVAEELVMSLEGDSYNERHMELTRKLHEGDLPSDQAEPVAPESGDVSDGVAEEIAEDLARVFIDRETSDYEGIISKYDVEFPVREVAMMEVMDASGATRAERVDEIREWVETWCDNPEEIEELNKRRPSRMGMPRRHS